MTMRSKKAKCAIRKQVRRTHTGIIESTKKKLSIIHNEMLCHISRKKNITKERAEKYLKEVSAISRSNECKKCADIGQVTEKLMRQMKTIIESNDEEYDMVCSSKINKNIGTQELRSSQSTPIYLDAEENIFEISENLRMIDIECSLETTNNLKVTDAGRVYVPMDLRTNCGDSKQHECYEINNNIQREQQKYPTERLAFLDDNSGELFSSPTSLILNNNQGKSSNANVGFNEFVNDTTLKKNTSHTNSTSLIIPYGTSSEQHGSLQDCDQNSQSVLANFNYTAPNIIEEEISPNQIKKVMGNSQTSSNNKGLVENNSYKIRSQEIKITSNFVLDEIKHDLRDGSAPNVKTRTLRKNKSTTKPIKNTELLAPVQIKAVKENKTKNMKKNKPTAKTTKSCDAINTMFSDENQHVRSKNTGTIRKPTSEIINNTFISENNAYNTNQEKIRNAKKPLSSADYKQCINFKNSFDDLLKDSINTIQDSENFTHMLEPKNKKTKKAKCRKVTNDIVKKAPSKDSTNKKSSEKEHHDRILDLSWVEKIQFVRSIDPNEYFETELDDIWYQELSPLKTIDTCTNKVLAFMNY